MTKDELESQKWFKAMPHDTAELLIQAFKLQDIVDKWDQSFSDYSFVVFPAAKAYEGFLKKLFFDLGFITEEQYQGRRFRVGKALNPELEHDLRVKEGVYDRLVSYCGGEELAGKLWEAWKSCRNSIFHWFPNEKSALSLEDAKARIQTIIAVISEAQQLYPKL